VIAEFSSFSWADARIHVVLSLLCTGDFIQVYHPNVDPRTGLVCLDFLTDKNWWTPVWTVDKILLVVVSLLHEPVMDGGAINREAAYLYKRKRRSRGRRPGSTRRRRQRHGMSHRLRQRRSAARRRPGAFPSCGTVS